MFSAFTAAPSETSVTDKGWQVQSSQPSTSMQTAAVVTGIAVAGTTLYMLYRRSLTKGPKDRHAIVLVVEKLNDELEK